MFGVLNGLTEPKPVFANTATPDVPTSLAEISRWKRACENLFSILYLITSGPAATLVRQYEDSTSVGGLGNGQKAWNALHAKYHNNSKEARWACYEKLVNLRTEQGQDSDDYTFKLLEVRGRLHQMGEQTTDDKIEHILLQGLTGDYEFVKMPNFHSPNFGIDDIQSMRNLNIDQLWRPGNVNKIAGRGAAMATTRKPRKVRCYNCL